MAVTKVVATVFGLSIAIEIIGIVFGFFSLKQMIADSAVPIVGAALFLMLLPNERWADLAPWILVIAMLIEPIIVPASGPLVIFDAVLPLTLILLLLARRRTVRRFEHELARRFGAAERTPAPQ